MLLLHLIALYLFVSSPLLSAGRSRSRSRTYCWLLPGGFPVCLQSNQASKTPLTISYIAHSFSLMLALDFDVFTAYR